MSTRIDTLQVFHVTESVGTVAPATSRYFHFGEHTFGGLKDGDIHLRAHLLEVDGEEEAGGTAANDDRVVSGSHGT